MAQRSDLTKLFNLCFEITDLLAHKVRDDRTLLGAFERATTSDENDVKEALTELIEAELTDEMMSSLRIGRGINSVDRRLALMTLMRTEIVAEIATRVLDDTQLRAIASQALTNQNDAQPLSATMASTYFVAGGARVLAGLFSPKPPRMN